MNGVKEERKKALGLLKELPSILSREEYASKLRKCKRTTDITLKRMLVIREQDKDDLLEEEEKAAIINFTQREPDLRNSKLSPVTEY